MKKPQTGKKEKCEREKGRHWLCVRKPEKRQEGYVRRKGLERAFGRSRTWGNRGKRKVQKGLNIMKCQRSKITTSEGNSQIKR